MREEEAVARDLPSRAQKSDGQPCPGPSTLGLRDDRARRQVRRRVARACGRRAGRLFVHGVSGSLWCAVGRVGARRAVRRAVSGRRRGVARARRLGAPAAQLRDLSAAGKNWNKGTNNFYDFAEPTLQKRC